MTEKEKNKDSKTEAVNEEDDSYKNSQESRIKRIEDIFFFILNNPKGVNNSQLFEQFKDSFRDKTSADGRHTAIRRIIGILDLLQTNTDFNDYFETNFYDKTHTVKFKAQLTKEQVLYLSKLILSSRTLDYDDAMEIITPLMTLLDEDDRPTIKRDCEGYARVRKNRNFDFLQRRNPLERIWVIEHCISQRQLIQFDYIKNNRREYNEEKEAYEIPEIHVVMKPLHVLFDNYYFYVIGLIESSDGNRTEYGSYRIDWIKEQPLGEQIANKENVNYIPDKDIVVAENQKLRDAIPTDNTERDLKSANANQGVKKTIVFNYYGFYEYVKDRFPQAEFKKLDEESKRFGFPVNRVHLTVNYSDSVIRWLLSQSPILKVIGPDKVVKDVKARLEKSLSQYSDLPKTHK